MFPQQQQQQQEQKALRDRKRGERERESQEVWMTCKRVGDAEGASEGWGRCMLALGWCLEILDTVKTITYMHAGEHRCETVVTNASPTTSLQTLQPLL